MAGMPTLSVPCGRVAGLPAGLQIISDHFKESNLFRVGSAVETVN